MMSVDLNPVIKERELARFLGARDDFNFSSSTTSKIERWSNVLKTFINPWVRYRMIRIESVDRNSVCLEGKLNLKSCNLSKTLRICEETVCFAATIGDRIEKVIKRCMSKNRYSDAYILDAMGSVAIENVVEQFHQRMALHYNKLGKAVTLRFSPGYCDWPVTDQKKIFSLFDSDQIGIELLDSCFIVPRKSILGIFGVYASNNGISNFSYNPCSECPKLDCKTRRV
ncbi:MAG: hypothetical protein JRJ29_02120 [Deltaproteobacteria bacterium]|nr:hypothetical protein [Deltaproteobacteria bacterium]